MNEAGCNKTYFESGLYVRQDLAEDKVDSCKVAAWDK